jgi:hypothetical protein
LKGFLIEVSSFVFWAHHIAFNMKIALFCRSRGFQLTPKQAEHETSMDSVWLALLILSISTMTMILLRTDYDEELSLALNQQVIDWNLTPNDIQNALTTIKNDHTCGQTLKDPRRLFLYSKAILTDAYSPTQIRKIQFDMLLNSPDSRDCAARERLERLLRSEEIHLNSTETSFDHFTKVCPEWNSPSSSFVVFRDHPLLKNKAYAYAERVQPIGLCYMHAPIVLQHYLLSMHTNDFVPMVDMAKYLRQHMSAEELEDRIWKGLGGDSAEFLKRILISGESTRFYVTNIHSRVEQLVMMYGPALVPRFRVENDFLETNSTVHIGPRRPTDSTGIHTMLLVGIRKEGNQTRYLLQNWWKTKPFVEVDVDYFDSCGGVFQFVGTRQTKMGNLCVNQHNRVECEELDLPERVAGLERNIHST